LEKYNDFKVAGVSQHVSQLGTAPPAELKVLFDLIRQGEEKFGMPEEQFRHRFLLCVPQWPL
jgi:hypothetical protein